MSQVELATDTQNAIADVVTGLIDAGASAGTISLFDGTRPASADDADAGTLLAVCTFSDPAYAAAVDGVAASNAITADSSANASGTARYFRVKDSNGNVIWQGSIGESGSGAALIMATTTVVIGQPVTVLSFDFTMPASCAC